LFKVGDKVITPNDKDFTQLKNGNWKNKHTGEIWSKDKSNHYGEGSWKVGVKKGANPMQNGLFLVSCSCVCQYSSSEILVLEK
jgi:hypothetical protein